MAKQELSYTFVNPNSPKAVEQMLKKILLEKLLLKSVDQPLSKSIS